MLRRLSPDLDLRSFAVRTWKRLTRSDQKTHSDRSRLSNSTLFKWFPAQQAQLFLKCTAQECTCYCALRSPMQNRHRVFIRWGQTARAASVTGWFLSDQLLMNTMAFELITRLEGVVLYDRISIFAVVCPVLDEAMSLSLTRKAQF